MPSIFLYTQYRKYIAIIFIFTLISPYTCKANDLNEIIKYFCLSSLSNETFDKNKSKDQEIREYTCKCFVDQVNKIKDLDDAREVCKQDTIKKFDL